MALGFASTVERSAPDPSGPTCPWHARRLVVRSLACATSQEKHGRQRGTRAVTAINALEERQPGQPRVPDEAAASQAAAAILATQRGEGLVHVTVTTDVPEHAKRRYGMRPATTVRSERVRGRAASAATTLAHAVRRLGGRLDATNHPAEEWSLAQGVAASRRASLIEQGFGRLNGRSVSLTPRCLQYAQRGVALSGLLSIARRVLGLRQCVVRRTLQQAGATLTGLYPGQPGRQTAPPTTERRWSAFRGVTLSRRKIDGKLHAHLTPLHAVPKRLLALLAVPLEIYDGLVT